MTQVLDSVVAPVIPPSAAPIDTPSPMLPRSINIALINLEVYRNTYRELLDDKITCENFENLITTLAQRSASVGDPQERVQQIAEMVVRLSTTGTNRSVRPAH